MKIFLSKLSFYSNYSSYLIPNIKYFLKLYLKFQLYKNLLRKTKDYLIKLVYKVLLNHLYYFQIAKPHHFSLFRYDGGSIIIASYLFPLLISLETNFVTSSIINLTGLSESPDELIFSFAQETIPFELSR